MSYAPYEVLTARLKIIRLSIYAISDTHVDTMILAEEIANKRVIALCQMLQKMGHYSGEMISFTECSKDERNRRKDGMQKAFKNTDTIGEIIKLSLEQGIVSLISALETYLKDIYIYSIDNCEHFRIIAINTHKDKMISIEELYDEYSLDLSSSFGDFIASRINFQNIDSANKAFKQTFKVDILNSIATDEICLLKEAFATRHLIIHNLGQIDKKYIKTTGKGLLGDQVVIEEEFITDVTKIIEKLGQSVHLKLDELNKQFSTTKAILHRRATKKKVSR